MNYKVFFELIHRYETITLEEIKSGGWPYYAVTGFGSPYTCTLCKEYGIFRDEAIIIECDNCPWMKLTNTMCGAGINAESYHKILDENTHRKLLNAFRNRAKYMREVLKLNNVEYELK
jgi:hypothetical protein